MRDRQPVIQLKCRQPTSHMSELPVSLLDGVLAIVLLAHNYENLELTDSF